MDSLVPQMVKNLCAMWETWVQCLGGEDPLEKEMAIHSTVLACRIQWTYEETEAQKKLNKIPKITYLVNDGTGTKF